MIVLFATCGFILLASGLFYLAVTQNNRQLKQVSIAINNEVKDRGLRVIAITNPGFNKWSESPFENEIRIGSLGFEGIPSNRQYYRILKCYDELSNSEKIIWVRATRNSKTKKLTLEWIENT